MMNDGVYVCSPPGATPVWFEHTVAEDENLESCFLEWTPTQPSGSASELENQIQGQSDESLTTGDYGVLATHPQRTSRETMNPQRLAALVVEKPSPTQPYGSGSTRVDTVGLPGPSSSQGIDDLTTQGFLTNSPQETVNRRSNTTRENGKRRHRGSNWSPEETTSFLIHMEKAVMAEKPPWRAVSEAMKREGYDRDKKATENRWGVLLAALKTDSHTDNNDSISSSRLDSERRESMMRILHVRPRVCRKVKSAPTPATPPTPSPPSGTDIEELSSLIARRESIEDQIVRVLRKQNEVSKEKEKCRKRKIRGGLGSGDDYDERTKP